MEVFEAILKRRSIRSFDPVKRLTNEQIKKLWEAARWAPSWANTQCWRLIVVRDSMIKSKLADALRAAREGAKNRAADAVRDVPIVIVACAERGVSGSYYAGEKRGMPATDKGEYWYMFDLGLAMQNVTLAAHALGLGTGHVGMFDAPKVAGILGVPDNVAVVELMPLGWPDEKPEVRPRKEVSQFTFYDKYSAP